jgi:hypothetical protein
MLIHLFQSNKESIEIIVILKEFANNIEFRCLQQKLAIYIARKEWGTGNEELWRK